MIVPDVADLLIAKKPLQQSCRIPVIFAEDIDVQILLTPRKLILRKVWKYTIAKESLFPSRYEWLMGQNLMFQWKETHKPGQTPNDSQKKLWGWYVSTFFNKIVVKKIADILDILPPAAKYINFFQLYLQLEQWLSTFWSLLRAIGVPREPLKMMFCYCKKGRMEICMPSSTTDRRVAHVNQAVAYG